MYLDGTKVFRDGLPDGPAVLTVLDNDLDQDGLPDDWEQRHGLDPSDPTGDHGPHGDPDPHGQTNLEELMAGTAPNDPDSVLRIRSAHVTADGQSLVLRFLAVSNRTYTIHACDRLCASAWTKLLDVPAVAESQLLSVTNAPPTWSTRFLCLATPGQP